MKPTSILSLLLFIRLVSATPVPFVLPDCKTSSCTAFVSNPNTPPIILPDPRFSFYQITLSSKTFDNIPVTPSSKLFANKALAAAFPLSSAFLKSLSNPAVSPPQHDLIAIKVVTTEDLPAKPTNALQELREEDAKLYWASRGGTSGEDIEATSNMEEQQTKHICGYTKYFQVHQKTSDNYGDFMVVGIVLLFLVVVVALEAAEKINGLRNLFVLPKPRRGEIYLEDETSALRKLFSQQKCTLQHIHVVSVTPSETGDYTLDEKA